MTTNMDRNLSKLSEVLVSFFEKEESEKLDKKITVNPVISQVASWYEKLRNAMDYRQEEVILRAAIERILKRRLLLGGTGKTIAEPLVRELVWARYFPDESVSESVIERIEKKIDLYLKLKEELLKKKNLEEGAVNEWIKHLMSSELGYVLKPNLKKELMINFMYQILKDDISITDDTEETRDAQVFIAVRKSFAKDDLAFLRYHLFLQIIGELTSQNFQKVSSSFISAKKEIEKQLGYPKKDKIVNYVKKRTPVFFILEDLLNYQKGNIRELTKNEEELKEEVFKICEARYKGISSKVQRAIIRSVAFIFLTKAFFAFGVEGTLENLIYGEVMWRSIVLNTAMAPVIMIIVGLFIRTPGRGNSEKIFSYIKEVLFNEAPRFGNLLTLKKAPDKEKPLFGFIFMVLWFATFVFLFGTVVYILTRLGFNFISQTIFLFFLAIVSFLSYRISQTAHVYNVDVKPKAASSIVDFLFIPFIQVGQKLTEGISQINIFLFLFDFIIETPFKGLFGFFEQWFLYLQSKREKLE